MLIRKMMKKDIEQIVLLEQASLGTTLGYDMLLNEISNDNMLYLVLVENDEVLGYISCITIKPVCEILNFCVLESQRGKGFGNYLFNELIAMMRNQSFQSFILEVKANNEIALNLYKKIGFQKINCRKAYYNDGQDAIVMEKIVGDVVC